jgi:hypothetical protein
MVNEALRRDRRARRKRKKARQIPQSTVNETTFILP